MTAINRDTIVFYRQHSLCGSPYLLPYARKSAIIHTPSLPLSLSLSPIKPRFSQSSHVALAEYPGGQGQCSPMHRTTLHRLLHWRRLGTRFVFETNLVRISACCEYCQRHFTRCCQPGYRLLMRAPRQTLTDATQDTGVVFRIVL